jgi:drug/metabolite transporter (DMT)-like permease
MSNVARGGASSLYVALTLAVAASFASGSSLAPIAYAAGSNPLAVNAVRASVAATVLAILLSLRGIPLALPPRERSITLALGIVNAVYSYALYAALIYVPVAMAVLIFYTYPLWTALVAWVTRSEVPTRRGVVAVVLGIIGVGLVVGTPATVPDWRGVGLALGAAFAFTFLLTVNARILRGRDSRPVTLHILVSACAIYFLAALLLREFPLPASAPGWSAFSAISLFYTFAIIGLFVAVGALGPVRTALSMNFEPVASVVLSWIILGQRLSPGQILGAAFVIAAITLAAWRVRAG